MTHGSFTVSLQVTVAFKIVYDSGLNVYALYLDCEGLRKSHRTYERTMSHLFKNYRTYSHKVSVSLLWTSANCSGAGFIVMSVNRNRQYTLLRGAEESGCYFWPDVKRLCRGCFVKLRVKDANPSCFNDNDLLVFRSSSLLHVSW